MKQVSVEIYCKWDTVLEIAIKAKMSQRDPCPLPSNNIVRKYLSAFHMPGTAQVEANKM